MRKATMKISISPPKAEGGHTNGAIYWKLLASPSSEIVFLSLQTKATSIILARPAAIKVYPNMVCTIVLTGRC